MSVSKWQLKHRYTKLIVSEKIKRHQDPTIYTIYKKSVSIKTHSE